MASPFSRTTRSLAADAGGGALWAWAVAALGLAAWALWFFGSHVTVQESSRQARLEVSQASHALVSELAGKVAADAAPLLIGRRVKAGEVLLALDSSAAQLRLQEAQARSRALAPRIAALETQIAALRELRQADRRASKAAVQTARARVDEAGAAAEFARDHAQRLRAEAGSGSVAEIDALRAQSESRRLGSSQAALRADQRRQALDAGTRASQVRVQIDALRVDVAALKGEQAAAQAEAARLEQEIDRHRLRAPVDGVLAEVLPLRPGSFVAAGQKLAAIVPAGPLLIVAEFAPATALGRVLPGQAARLRLDGFPWAQYGSLEAQVLRVAGEVRDGTLRVELGPDATAATGRLPLQHGLTGVVEVAVEQATPAQLVLRAAGQAFGVAAAP